MTAGGLVSAWQRMADALAPWYEQAHRQLLATACLHADETGWRVDGATHWLWCFCDRATCLYLIDRSRGGPALKRFFDEAFAGTLVTDFWAAYDAVAADDRQVCLPHLFRELAKVDERNASPGWLAFAKKLKRLLRDGLRLRKRPDFTPDRYRSRVDLIDRRLAALADAAYDDPDAARLAKRLGRFRDYYFTFLEKPGVPPDNNHAERQIRPGRHPAEDDPVQPVDGRGRGAGGADERVPDAAAARPRPDADDRRRAAGADLDRQTAAAAGASRCRRLKCYAVASSPAANVSRATSRSLADSSNVSAVTPLTHSIVTCPAA